MGQPLTQKKSLYQKYTDIMPLGAGALFFIQMFATFAYSVLYSTLVLYATNGLHLSDSTANGVTSSFIAFNYALHLLGGYVGGRFMSYRSLFAIGMVLQVIGCGLISMPSVDSLYWGLAFFLTGAGLNVTCINCMLTQLFAPDDKRRESAFLWNYSGMNVGFFVGFSVSGYLQLQNAYHLLFMLAGVGNLITLFLVFMHWKKIGDTKTSYLHLPADEKKFAYLKGLAFITTLALALRVLLKNAHASNSLILLVGAATIFVIAYFAFKQSSPTAQKKIWAYLILGLASVVFWTLYQMAPMGLTLFIERNVDRHYLGLFIAPQWVQNINTVIIIVGGPLLSVFFTWLRDRGINITIPLQFAFALFIIGVGLAILPIGIHLADAHGYVNFNWILWSYICQSIGELFISPIGYAMVGQLAPVNLQGPMMGIWMMTTGVGATLSGYFSNLALSASNSTNPLISNPGFSHAFSLLGWISIGTGVLLLVVTPFVLRLTQEKKLFAKPQMVSPMGL
ncbi:MAG: oligopeptide:H+ symporter [Gammaproteobacteria bacterium]|nr:oligopeptide:H+ symporter [Gammaproteobacteria bacterium]